ncbi:FUSC family protein [Streptomyces sp. NPDC093984]|uniref:FUSC family protein n=1 Tax=Streptomyces sp. NPDC093984 TaxID=3366052 RepID=UPI00381721B9
MTATPLDRARASRLLARLVRTQPAPQRYRTATIAAVCMALPMSLAFAAHRPALGAIGGLGSFAALYGRPSPPARDARAVALATLGLAVGFWVCGTAQGRPWLAVAVTGAWATVVTLVCGAFAARPPGMVMPVLVGAVATALPPRDPLPLVAAIAATGLLATLLVWVSACLRDLGSAHAGHPAPDRSPTHGRPRRQPWRPGPLRPPTWQLYAPTLTWAGLRTGAGVALGGVLALAIGAPHPFWAMATAAAILTAGNHATSVNDRALLRGTGTLVGCLVAGAVLAFHPGTAMTVLLLAFFAFATECVVARNYALAMISVTPTATVLASVASPVTVAPWTLAGERLLQTLLGCVGAVAAGQLVTVHWAVEQRLRAVRAVLVAAADLLEEPEPDGPGDRNADILTRRIRHLSLVSERAAGERPAVRNGIAELDAVVRDTNAVADEALRRHREAEKGDHTYAEPLRSLAALLATAESEPPRRDLAAPHRPCTRPELARLTDSVQEWIFTGGGRNPNLGHGLA